MKTVLYARESVAFDEVLIVRDTDGDPIDITGWTFALVLQRQAGAPDVTLGMAANPGDEGFEVVDGAAGALRMVIAQATLADIPDTTGNFTMFGDLLGTPSGGSARFVSDVRMTVTTAGNDFRGATYQLILDALGVSVLAQIDGRIADIEAEGDTQVERVQTEGAVQVGLAEEQAQLAVIAADGLATRTDEIDSIKPAVDQRLVEYRSGRPEGWTNAASPSDFGDYTFTINDEWLPGDRCVGVEVQAIAGGGDLSVRQFQRSGTSETQVGDAQDFTLVAGRNTFLASEGTFVPFEMVSAGHMGGYTSGGLACLFGSTIGDSDGYYNVAGDQSSWTDSSRTLNFQLQISFIMERRLTRPVADEVATSFADKGWARAARCVVYASANYWQAGWQYGQSLSHGNDGQPALSVTQPYNNLMAGGGLKQYAVTTTAALIEDNLDEGGVSGGVLGETGVAAGLNHFVRLAALNCGIDPARLIMFGGATGVSGKTIGQLSRYSTSYFEPRLMTPIRSVRDIADAAGKSFRVPYVTYFQGEADAQLGQSFDYYYGFLLKLWREIDAAVRIAIPEQEYPVHLLINQQGFDATSGGLGTMTAQAAAARNSPYIHMVSPIYHLPRSEDAIHSINIGYIRLGHLAGRAAHQLATIIDPDTGQVLKGGRKPDCLMPLSVTADGTTAWAKFRVPTRPIVIDTTTLASVTGRGFKITDDTGTLTLSDIQVLSDGETVQMTLNRALGANPVWRLGLDYLAAGLSISGGASTNFRDSTPDTHKIGGTDYPMWHWAVADSGTVRKLAYAA